MNTFLIWRTKHVSETHFTLFIGAIVGILSGLAAVVLKSMVHFIQNYLAEDVFFVEDYDYGLVFYPIIGLLLTVFLAKFVFVGHKFGYGITSILDSIANRKGKVAKDNMYSHMIMSAITVAFGGSTGLEASMVTTGGALGSNVGSVFYLTKKSRNLLIGCGVAGAISAIFNAPVGGVIFALEVVLIETRISQIIPILIASVSAKLVSMILLTEEILFYFHLKDDFLTSDVIYCIALGVLCGLLSLYIVFVVRKVEKIASNIDNAYVRAICGGLLLSVIIIWFPPIYGEGYGLIKSFLNGNEFHVFYRNPFFDELPQDWVFIGYVFLVGMAKVTAAAITRGAGGSGGIFAPSLFTGGVLGFVFARTVNELGLGHISESNFTLIGMCGAMSGVQYAPLSAIFLIAELTSGYELFMPLMLVSAITFITVSYFEPHSIYTKDLVASGNLVNGNQDKKILRQLSIRALVEKNFQTVHPETKLKDLIKAFQLTDRNLFPVVDEEMSLVGIFMLDDMRRVMFDESKKDTLMAKDLMSPPTAYVYVEEDMETVMQKFEEVKAWNLPVLENGEYIGFISRSSIFALYREAIQNEV
jgi:CIC family chloride channel protein